MSPYTIEAVRCALMTVCETGGTMDELALIEQADMISELTLKLASLQEAAQAEVDRQRHQCGILRQELQPTTAALAVLLQGEGDE